MVAFGINGFIQIAYTRSTAKAAFVVVHCINRLNSVNSLDTTLTRQFQEIYIPPLPPIVKSRRGEGKESRKLNCNVQRERGGEGEGGGGVTTNSPSPGEGVWVFLEQHIRVPSSRRLQL